MLDDLGGSGAVAGLVAVVVVLVKLVDFLLTKVVELMTKKDVVAETEHKEEHQILHDIQSNVARLTEMHNKFDEDGTPLWYVPRSWAETQSQISTGMSQVSNTQENMSKVLERVVVIMDRMDRRQEVFFSHEKAERKGK